MRTLIIGMGEVGKAHFNNLAKTYGSNIFFKDKEPQCYDYTGKEVYAPNCIDLMLIATQCDPANMDPFYNMVWNYCNEFQAPIVDILTTTPPGTVERLDYPYHTFNKSSTRGMHPHLDSFLLDIPKHIGGPNAIKLKEFYEGAGWTCVTHKKARTVELSHILNNIIYGINIMAADECARVCRHYGVDYMEFIKYRETQNSGFIKAGYPSKVSPILMPLNGGDIGGHCVKYAASIIPDWLKTPLIKLLAEHKGVK